MNLRKRLERLEHEKGAGQSAAAPRKDALAKITKYEEPTRDEAATPIHCPPKYRRALSTVDAGADERRKISGFRLDRHSLRCHRPAMPR
jgi:hypothetical protein